MSYLKFKLGLPQNIIIGDARNLIPNSRVPKVGSAILFKEHAGYVFFFNDDYVVFEESNFEKCRKTVRTLQLDDEQIRGYLIYKSPVLVYNKK